MFKIFKVFLVFLKIGAFTFGGGYAMIPLIERETSEKEKWITSEDMLDIVAIAESTPGPVAVNCATFVGYKVAGFFGAFFATIGVCLPAFLIMLLLSSVITYFYDYKAVRYAFYGIRAGVLALIFKALLSMYKKCPKSLFSYIIMALAFALVAFVKIKVIFAILICAIIGLIVYFVTERRKA